jgi:transcriptional regulator with XRE-family HTH domain
VDDDAVTSMISKRVQQRRKELGFSQELLGATCGIHRTYIGAIERGEKKVTVVTLHRIAKALKTNLATILEEGNEP